MNRQALARPSIVMLPLLCLALALILALGKTPDVEASTAGPIAPGQTAPVTAAPNMLSASAVAPVATPASTSAPAPDATPKATPTTTPAITTVSLAIDFGNGFEMHYTALPHTPKMTAFDVLQRAGEHAHPLTFKHTGSGTTAFISQIGDTTNQKGPESFYWQYRVNGQYAKKGAGAYEISPGDQVRWFYGKYEAAKEPATP